MTTPTPEVLDDEALLRKHLTPKQYGMIEWCCKHEKMPGLVDVVVDLCRKMEERP